MRGKAWAEAKVPADERITPAYAGKSLCHGVCGRVKLGSPPPMRGKERCIFACDSGAGITPAYAGKRAESLRT